MRTFMFIAIVALAAVLSACTSTTPTTASSDKPIYTTEKKVYPKAELDKRGRQTPGEALAAQDASITYTGRH